MLSFRDFIDNSLTESISKEFKDAAGPLILKEFSDCMSRVGISVQNANFIKLSNSDKKLLKRKISENKLDELPFGQRFIVFVYPYSKKFYDDFMNARKNPDPEKEFSYDSKKHEYRNLGNLAILDRIDGKIIRMWMDYAAPYEYKDRKYVFLKPEAKTRTEYIDKGVTLEFKSYINDDSIIAFTFDTKADDTNALRTQRYNDKKNTDPLYNDGYGINAQTQMRHYKLNQLKNNKAVVLYKDKIKRIGNDLIKELQNKINKFFNDLDKDPRSAVLSMYDIKSKLSNYDDLCNCMRSAIVDPEHYNKTNDIENYLKLFK